MRVISGKVRGLKLDTPKNEDVRPTTDRVKESLFNIINPYIIDSNVLDLFAGSGQLGIETISNGAKLCYFVDNNGEVIKVLRDNIKTLDISGYSKIILSDWKKMLNEFGKNKQKFDLIFVDPPYDYDVYEKVINKVNELDLLKDNGLLILEYANNKFLDEYDKLIAIKEKKYGYKFIKIFKKRSS